MKKGIFKNFANFTGKHLWWSLLLIKLQAIRKTPTRVLSCNICEIFKNNYFEEHLRTTASFCIRFKSVNFTISREFSQRKKLSYQSLNITSYVVRLTLVKYILFILPFTVFEEQCLAQRFCKLSEKVTFKQ